MKKRWLTKSRFKLAYECPTKLYYADHPEKYKSTMQDNDFLKALAEGGFQVGALAKLYYPGGVDLEGMRIEEALTRTRELIAAHEKVVIFEAALSHGPYLVLADILIRDGNHLQLIEVKSKSISDEDEFFAKSGQRRINSKFESYMVDVAFQTFVARLQYPDFQVTPNLMFADKDATASVDGLHQLFRIEVVNGRSKVVVNEAARTMDLGEKLLRVIPVQEEVGHVLNHMRFQGMSLPEYAEKLAENHTAGRKWSAEIAPHCKQCEFRVPGSGFDECIRESGLVGPDEIGEPTIFDLWNFRGAEAALKKEVILLKDLDEGALEGSNGERQLLQLQAVKNNETAATVDHEKLAALFRGIRYPLHFIDFETTMVAIPFFKGRKPYEQHAFQFSHHVLSQDGRVEHRDQYLHCIVGQLPNFEFVRHLKKSLSGDDGTVFRFSHHETTVLKQIADQILAARPEDTEDLLSFIRELDPKIGTRPIQDLRKWVMDCYYSPKMGGSNSIKKVCPAIVSDSKFIQEKYRKPISSLNSADFIWIQKDEAGDIRDPYTLLPKMVSEVADSSLFAREEIKDGGAAMTAWAKMQFQEMSELERTEITNALFRYCELDTLSMVWIVEGLQEYLNSPAAVNH